MAYSIQDLRHKALQIPLFVIECIQRCFYVGQSVGDGERLLRRKDLGNEQKRVRPIVLRIACLLRE